MKITCLNFDVFCRNVLLKEIFLVNFPPKILLRGKFTRHISKQDILTKRQNLIGCFHALGINSRW
jgi:hypothetical protein